MNHLFKKEKDTNKNTLRTQFESLSSIYNI